MESVLSRLRKPQRVRRGIAAVNRRVNPVRLEREIAALREQLADALVEGIPKREIAPFLPADPVIVEAGAHNGSDTLEMARLWPRGQIHAFEPIPHVYRRLEARTAELRNVRTYQIALGAETGTASMWLSSGTGDASSSFLDPKKHLEVFPTIEFRETIEVPVTTLDDWSQSANVTRVDFMWLDLQGYEFAALQHAKRVLPTVSAIVLEVSIEELYADMPLWPEVQAWLQAQGFAIVHQILRRTYGNALAVRETLLYRLTDPPI
jgi:FkbM family methyltransferase